MSDNDSKRFLLPVGRMINNSLFEKDAFVSPNGQEGKPSYKIEVAFDPADLEGEGKFDEYLAETAAEQWGDKAWDDFFDGGIISPLLDGNKLAAAREAKNKPGDAYKGKTVLRMKTDFNKHGQDAPGGVAVYDEEVNEITIANSDQIYNGCMVQVACMAATYTTNRGEKALTVYFSGVQKIADGERLASGFDHSSLFKPVGRAAKSESGGEEDGESRRRRRKG